jgi:hypothetical protein
MTEKYTYLRCGASESYAARNEQGSAPGFSFEMPRSVAVKDRRVQSRRGEYPIGPSESMYAMESCAARGGFQSTENLTHSTEKARVLREWCLFK